MIFKKYVVFTLGLIEMPDGTINTNTIGFVNEKYAADAGAELIEFEGEPQEVLDKHGNKHLLYTTVGGEKFITE